MVEDIIALHDEAGPPGAEALLVEAMRNGRRTVDEALHASRRRCRDRLASLPAALRTLDSGTYPVRRSPRLEALVHQMSVFPPAVHSVHPGMHSAIPAGR